MSKRSAIVYTSHTGNTEKVAMAFKKAFEKKGWECDTFKVTKDTPPDELPDFDEYDFICAGSPVIDRLPAREIFFGRPYGPGMRKGGGGPGSSTTAGGVPEAGRRESGAMVLRGKLDKPFGPKKSVVFVTYSGELRGPTEATSALDLLQLRLEDGNIKCVGRFACPGSWRDLRKTVGRPWHYDLENRPNERDLQKAEIFLEEILEDYYYDGELEATPLTQYICIA